MNRPRRTAAAAAALALATGGGCADDGGRAGVREAMDSMVSITAQRCEQPNDIHGLGVVVGADLILTAGHTVEGQLRRLLVDGQPAAVVDIDRNADLAVVHAPLPPGTDGPPGVAISALRPDRLILLAPDGPRTVAVHSRQTLVIEHVSDLTTYRRDVIVFEPGVTEGSSGSALVDDQGRLAGIVILNDGSADRGIAVTAEEAGAVLAAAVAATAATETTAPVSC